MKDDMEMGSESANPQSEDYSQGYMITVTVSPNGFHVEGPQPWDKPQGEYEEMEELPDMASALKHVMAIVKENPVGNDAEAQMQAGYEARNA